jgi:hypothetical protein
MTQRIPCETTFERTILEQKATNAEAKAIAGATRT